MSECAAIIVSFKEEPFFRSSHTLYTTIVFSTNAVFWSSDSRRSEKYNVPSILLFLSFLSLIFQALYTKSSSIQGDQRTRHNAHFVAPSKIWYTAVSQWRQSQGIFHVCLSSDSKHAFVISLENFKSGHDFSSILWDQQEVLFYLSKLNFLFINEMQSVFIEEQLTSDVFLWQRYPLSVKWNLSFWNTLLIPTDRFVVWSPPFIFSPLSSHWGILILSSDICHN